MPDSPVSESYRNRVQRGQRVQLTDPVRFRQGTIPAGAGGVVISESNAGFRGIEAFVAFDSGERANVSTGLLRVA